jgi:ArsR family transcriptional regulator
MDSAALLDLLGNENRRRILRLLSRKPCYVTEISEYLGVSPKAVIDHLRKLDEAGLVESHVDDGRRKYFSIARDFRLEVNVSPYEFGTKSAYSASPNLDITSWRYVSLHLGGEEGATDAADAADASDASDAPASAEASSAGAAGTEDRSAGDDPTTDGQRDDDAGIDPSDPDRGDDETPDLDRLVTDLERLERLENELSMAQRWVQGRLTQTFDRISAHFEGVDGRFYGDLLRALVDGPETADALARRVDAPPDVVTDALEGLSAHGVVERRGDRWRLRTDG